VTSKEIFRQYFKKKLIIWVSIGIAATLIRLLGGHETTFAFAATFLSFFVLAAVVIGYIDYNFYEKSAPKIITGLLDTEPLLHFQRIGFTKEEGNKLEGLINNYKIILSPLTNLQNDKVLTVLIPLQIREGLDSYFTRYNDHFRFSLSGEIIFAEASLKDYDKQYHYNMIFDLIEKTTNSLRENKIEPLNITDD
jgi:hypothetical protein